MICSFKARGWWLDQSSAEKMLYWCNTPIAIVMMMFSKRETRTQYMKTSRTAKCMRRTSTDVEDL